jgi:hypothetical protein
LRSRDKRIAKRKGKWEERRPGKAMAKAGFASKSVLLRTKRGKM